MNEHDWCSFTLNDFRGKYFDCTSEEGKEDKMINTIVYAMDVARRKFSMGEQKMLIDIFNGTMLTPQILGQHLIAQVEDSFSLYHGMYEEKWGVKKEEMLEKIKSLNPLQSALVELWAVGFWIINTGETGQLEDYVAGRLNLETMIEKIISKLKNTCENLEKTKSAFKSATIANARTEIEDVLKVLENFN